MLVIFWWYFGIVRIQSYWADTGQVLVCPGSVLKQREWLYGAKDMEARKQGQSRQKPASPM